MTRRNKSMKDEHNDKKERVNESDKMKSPLPPQQDHPNLIRLCGSVWTPCGYCKGRRAHLAQRPQIHSTTDPTKPSDSARMECDASNQQGITATKRDDSFDKTSTIPEDEAKSSLAYSILSTNLTTKCYEETIQRGWRRSGTAIYKPNNWLSCCPALSIRLHAKHFVPTKSQRKITKRLQALLQPDTYNSRQPITQQPQQTPTHTTVPRAILQYWDDCTTMALQELLCSPESSWNNSKNLIPVVQFKQVHGHHYLKSKTKKNLTNLVTIMSTVCAAIAGRSRGTIDKRHMAQELVQKLQSLSLSPSSTMSCVVEYHEKSGQILVHCDLPQQPIAETNEVQQQQKQSNNHEDKIIPQTFDHHNHLKTGDVLPIQTDRLNEWLNTQGIACDLSPPYDLQLTTVPAYESALDPRVHQLYWEYQHVVHQDPYPGGDRPSLNRKRSSVVAEKQNECNHSRSSSNTNETKVYNEPNPVATESQKLYDDWDREYCAPNGWRQQAEQMLTEEYGHLSMEKRQQLEKSFLTFCEFLVENPFQNESAIKTTETRPLLGTYHQHYTLSGNVLIAVGVVDILPSGLSSVYLFYDPSFAHQLLPLGKYAILKEIEWTAQAGLPYYYLGYYIESCPKMNYKSEYMPSELLCPTTYQWVDIKIATRILRTESPGHFCCTIYKKYHGDATNTNNNKDDESTSAGLYSSKRSRTTNAARKYDLAQIPMDIGAGMLVTLGMLQPDGQDLVQPLLLEYAEQIGPELATQCVVNLR